VFGKSAVSLIRVECVFKGECIWGEVSPLCHRIDHSAITSPWGSVRYTGLPHLVSTSTVSMWSGAISSAQLSSDGRPPVDSSPTNADSSWWSSASWIRWQLSSKVSIWINTSAIWSVGLAQVIRIHMNWKRLISINVRSTSKMVTFCV